MILALLKLILCGVLIFFAIHLLTDKEASTTKKGIGIALAVIAALTLIPMLLTFTIYSIGVIFLAAIAYLIYKTIV
jgi:hypothetical protein